MPGAWRRLVVGILDAWLLQRAWQLAKPAGRLRTVRIDCAVGMGRLHVRFTCLTVPRLCVENTWCWMSIDLIALLGFRVQCFLVFSIVSAGHTLGSSRLSSQGPAAPLVVRSRRLPQVTGKCCPAPSRNIGLYVTLSSSFLPSCSKATCTLTSATHRDAWLLNFSLG